MNSDNNNSTTQSRLRRDSALITRKEFLKSAALGASAFLCAGTGYGFLGKKNSKAESVKGHIFKGDAPKKPWKWSIEGFYYTTDGKVVQCHVCPNRCVLNPGDRSICRSKVNIGGKLYSLAYGNPCAVHVDPIEKKPLNHFYPRSLIFSIATTGCNFRCLNCQNWGISQKKPEEVEHIELFPEGVVREAKKKKMTYLSINFPRKYNLSNKIFLKNIISEVDGIKFCIILMKKVLDTQVEKITKNK